MKKPLLLHPVLFALHPVLFAYAHNIEEVTFGQTLLPAAVILAGTGMLWLLCWAVYRDLWKAGIVVSAFLLLFFSYGHVVDALVQWGLWMRMRYSLLIWAVLVLGVVALVTRTSRSLVSLTKVLNVVGVCLVGLCLFGIACFQVRALKGAGAAPAPRRDGAAQATAVPTENLPDIYYLMPDQYPRPDILKEVYDCDVSDFTDYLARRGFYLARESRSNYHRTWLSLGSSLNMEHLLELAKEGGSRGITHRRVFPMIRDHRVARFLKSRGYKYLHFGSWWNPTMRNEAADLNFNLQVLPELAGLIYSQTPLRPILWYFGVYDTRRMQWKRVLYKLENLAQVPSIEGPKFVFAHILVPHKPYVFNSDGSFLTEARARELSRKEKVKGQVLFLNKVFKQLIDELLAKSRVPPIIILQADEGPFPDGLRPDYRHATPAQLREKMCILNAYHLPGLPKDALYPSITPVNSFRLVFNHYFGTDFELLPDESYVTVSASGRQFLKVTEKLTGGETGDWSRREGTRQ